MKGIRYYLHGDVTEHNPRLVFCIRCDRFVPRSHFNGISTDHGGINPLTDYGYFKRDFTIFYSKKCTLDKKYRRPKDAKNIFSGRPA
jgi:hypothetical protein